MLKRWVVRAPSGTMRYWVTLVGVVARCGAGRRMQLKILLLGLVMPLRDKLIGPREARVRLRWGRLEVPWIVGPRSDLEVLNEVLVQRTYEWGLPSVEPKLILDLGSHMGASILFWRERFPSAAIVGVEPDPVTFDRLCRNVGAFESVELRNLAVSELDGPVRFFPAEQGWVSGLSGQGEPVTVEGRSFRSLLTDIGPVDLLKVDTEGAEQYVLDDWALEQVAAIVGEYHHGGDPGQATRFVEHLRRHFDVRVTTPLILFSGSREHAVVGTHPGPHE